MHLFTLLVLTLSKLVFAVDIIWFTKDNSCHLSDDNLGCAGIPSNTCCNNASPYCEKVKLNGGSAGNTLLAVSENNCDLTNIYATCSNIGDAGCCMSPAAGASTAACSSTWLVSARENEKSKEDSTECMDPNKLTYNNGTGMREIIIPVGAFQSVMDEYHDKNFTALGLYASWTD